MKVRVSDPALVDDLLAFLRRDGACIAAPAGDDAVEVSLLGSWGAEGARMALDLKLQLWRAVRDADAEIVT